MDIDRKECPLCGCSMQRRQTQSVTRVPGNATSQTHTTTEWVCPDCDYFEEAEDN